MSISRERILEMLAKQEITPEEADTLLKALRQGERSRARWLRNPLERLGERGALVGVAALVIGLFLSRSGVRFDGALDVHLARAAVPLTVACLDQLVAWPLTAAVLWLVAAALSPRGRTGARPVDFLAAVGIARLPICAVGLATALFPLPIEEVERLAAHEGRPPAGLLWLTLLALPFLGIAIAWLYQGWKTASGLVRGRAVGGFIIAIVVAEVASKLVLAALAR